MILEFNLEAQQGVYTNSERLKHTQRHSRRSCFVISAEGGNDEQLSEAEKIAGSDFS